MRSKLLLLMTVSLLSGNLPAKERSTFYKNTLLLKSISSTLDDPSKIISRPQSGCPNPSQALPDCFQLTHEEITNRCLAGRESEAFIKIDRVDTHPCLSFAGISFRELENLIHYEIGIVDGVITARIHLFFHGLEDFSDEEKSLVKEKLQEGLEAAQALYRLHGLNLSLSSTYSDEAPQTSIENPAVIQLDRNRGTTSQSHWYLDLSNQVPGEWGKLQNRGLHGITFPGLIAHELAHFLGLTDEREEDMCNGDLKERNEERIENGLLYTDCAWGAKCVNLMVENLQNPKNMLSFAQDAYAEILSPLCPNVCRSSYSVPRHP